MKSPLWLAVDRALQIAGGLLAGSESDRFFDGDSVAGYPIPRGVSYCDPIQEGRLDEEGRTVITHQILSLRLPHCCLRLPLTVPHVRYVRLLELLKGRQRPCVSVRENG